MNLPESNRLKSPGLGRLLVTAVLLAAAVMATVSAVGFLETRRAMSSAAMAQARAVAAAVRQDLERAAGFGIPLGKLGGVAEYLGQRAARANGIAFLAVSGEDGRRLHGAGVEPAVIDRALSVLSRHHDENADAAEAEGFLLQRLPLRGGSGAAVVVGVDPLQAMAGLRHQMIESVPFWLGCMLLAAVWARTAAVAAVAEPLARLRVAMRQAAGGVFTVLLARRSRDAVGRCLFAFNAAVAGVYARRQTYAAQADEVRHAVFDADVAQQVVMAKEKVLGALGDGLAQPPRRVIDPRGTDRDMFANAAIAAGMIGICDAVEFLADDRLSVALVSAVFLVVGALASRWGWRRGVGVAVALVVTVYAGYLESQAAVSSPLLLVLAGLGAAVAGWSAGLAIRQRGIARRALAGSDDAACDAGGWRWPVIGGAVAGVAMAWTLWGDPVTTGAGSAFLGLVMLLAAAVSGVAGSKEN